MFSVIAFGNDGVEPFRVTGFGSAGVVYAADETLLQRDFTQPDTFEGDWSWKADSLLGLQFDAPLQPTLSATAQFVFKERADNRFAESLGWAFLRYRPNQEWMWRAGRLGLDIYLLSDYRNVGFAYLWARPPTEFYGPLALDDFDGADITYSRAIADGTLHFKLFGGISKQIAHYSEEENLPLDFKPAWGANISFESEHWRIQTAFGRVRFDSEIPAARELLAALRDPTLAPAWPQAAALADDLKAEGRHLTFYSAGIAYDDNQWIVQSELGYLRSEWATLRSIASAYVSAGRRIGDITPYILLAIARPAGKRVDVTPPSVSGDPTIDAVYAGAQGYANQFQVEQKTLSFGSRWDVLPDVAVKLQWDHSWIAADGGSLGFSKPGTWSNDAKSSDLFSLNVNFLF